MGRAEHHREVSLEVGEVAEDPKVPRFEVVESEQPRRRCRVGIDREELTARSERTCLRPLKAEAP
jgi:hypothetical protein